MNQYNIGVYAAEYLSLLEFMTGMEKELPQAKLSIFCDSELAELLPAEAMSYFAESFDELLLSSSIVLLTQPGEEYRNILEKYGGTVINAANEPLLDMLHSIAQINEELHITLGLPLAIYGKDGVDSLMRETRSIYTFDNDIDSILPMGIAFNVHFYKSGLPSGKWDTELKELRKYANVDLRINPTSTVFVADIYGCDPVELPEDMEFFTPKTDFSFNDINSGYQIALTRSDDDRMITIAGDYLHMKTVKLINTVKNTLTK